MLLPPPRSTLFPYTTLFRSYLRLEGRDGHYGPQRLTWGKRMPDHSRPVEETFEFAAPDDSWDREWHEFHTRSEEHTSELQSRLHLVCRLLLEKKKKK